MTKLSLFLFGSFVVSAFAQAQNLSRAHTFTVSPSAAPYLVTLDVPSGANIRNISQAGHYDAAGAQILWGPFESTDTVEFSFAVISDGSTSIPQSAQIVYPGSSETGPSAAFSPPERTYASWIAETAPSGASTIRLSASLDYDGDGIPNAIEYLLGLDLSAADSPWDALELDQSGSFNQLSFPRSIGASDHQLLLVVLDLKNGGAITEVIQATWINGAYRIEGLGDQLFFRLASAPR